MASNDRVLLLSSALLSVSWVVMVTGWLPGGGLTLCFLFLPDTGDTDWLRRPEGCGLLSSVCGSARPELVIWLTSASASSPWDRCGDSLFGEAEGGSAPGTVRV